MIHGAGGGSWEFRHWRPVFEAAGAECVIPDLQPASGGLAGTTFRDYVEQVLSVSGPRVDVVVGASLGGALALWICPDIDPGALVLIGTPPPAGLSKALKLREDPDVVKWSQSSLSDTEESMLDCDREEICFAHSKWRDESGAVLRELSLGISADKPACPTLCIIPGSDETIPPADQIELMRWAEGDGFFLAGMSHLGPLMSPRAGEVAGMALHWVQQRLYR